MNRVGAAITVIVLAILAAASASLLGWWALVPAGLLVALALVGASARAAPDGWYVAATIAGTLGGAVGVAGALAALAIYGGTAPYAERAALGVAALLGAALVLLGAALIHRRPVAAAGLLLAGSTGGSLAMAGFTIDTWYFAALPICWLGATLVLPLAKRPIGTRGAGTKR